MVASNNKKDLKSSRIVLIDFGLAKPYLSDLDKHIEIKDNEKF